VPHPSFTMMVPNNTEPLRTAQVMQSMAAEAGFDIKLQAVEFASSLDLAQKGDFEAYLIGWSGRTDPDANLYNFISCKGPPALNSSKYCNPEVDAELDAERSAATPEERMAHFAKIAAITLVDRPLIYYNHLKWPYAMSAKLTGFTPYPDGLIRPQGIAMQ
jgi:peptide/nickel transport system substrate-binding protein